MGAKTLTCLSCAQLNRVPEDKLGRGPKCATCGAALLPGKPIDVDPAILQKAVRNDDLPLVADFWAPWCGPCRSMAPEFAKAAKALDGRARLVKLNTQDHASAGCPVPDPRHSHLDRLRARQGEEAPVGRDAAEPDHWLAAQLTSGPLASGTALLRR